MRFTDNALYRAAMGYARSGGSIVNGDNACGDAFEAYRKAKGDERDENI